MTITDLVTPLSTASEFLASTYADLGRYLPDGELENVMREATRACENECAGRRLAPFLGYVETIRAEGIDADDSGVGGQPLNLAGMTGVSFASALGSAGDTVRRVWLSEYAHNYPDLWTYTVQSIVITPPVGGPVAVAPASVDGPDVDTGQITLPFGTWCPVGSLVRVTYGGGYSTVPADLARACRAMAASLIVRELNPDVGTSHDADALFDASTRLLAPYAPASRKR